MDFSKKTALLRDRAAMLAEVRAFFQSRNVLEIDCSALVRCPPLDANVEVISADATERQIGYLHTSPEYAMKRLLCSGVGDIYFLGHVFRKGEIGPRHNPEFTMVEWYRIHISFDRFIEETCELIALFLGKLPIRRLSYRNVLQTYAGIDPFSPVDFLLAAKKLGIETPSNSNEWDRDTWLHLFLSHAVEPHLGQGELTVLTDYPPSQAALARLVEKEGFPVAERFEIYHQGVELTNGYHELANAKEQRLRFEEQNQYRVYQGKAPYALDEKFLAALEKGLPDCCGVSVGFDRLMLLRHKSRTLVEVLPFAWEEL